MLKLPTAVIGMKDLEAIIKELIENVKSLESVIEGIKKPVSESSQLIPETTRNIEDVMAYLEKESHKIMSLLEEINKNSEEIKKDINFLLSLNPVNQIKSRLESVNSKNEENIKKILELYSHLSFHDLAGQQLKLVLELLENIKNALLNVIVSQVAREKDLKKEEISGLKGKVSEILSKDRVSQEDVDALLEEFGL